MEKEYKDKTLIQTHVWSGDKAFFVSTINRQSSAALADIVYAETIVWEWNPKTRKREKMLWQGEDIEDSISTHLDIVQTISDTGSCEHKYNGGE